MDLVLHPLSLCSAYWCGLCLLPCVFPQWNHARSWQRSAKDLKPLLFHTVNRLLPHIPTHCDTSMYHEVPYDNKSDWPAECQGIRCLSLQGELVNLWEFPRDVSKRASWPFHRRSVDQGWVSTGRLALVCWVQRR